MSLADAPAGERRMRPGPRCWYATVPLTAEDRAWLDEQKSSRTRTYHEISTAISAEYGVEISDPAIGWHMRGRCTCR